MVSFNDINDSPNISHDGINMAQHVMNAVGNATSKSLTPCMGIYLDWDAYSSWTMARAM